MFDANHILALKMFDANIFDGSHKPLEAATPLPTNQVDLYDWEKQARMAGIIAMQLWCNNLISASRDIVV